MNRALAGILFAAVACGPTGPAERYSFVARLGNDTVSVESITRRGDKLSVDGVDRFPRVRTRHTEITLDQNGGIHHLVMDVATPSDSAKRQKLHVVADVTKDSVIMVKTDGTGAMRWAFAHGGAIVMAHVPQMYSLYELYFQAAMKKMAVAPQPGDTVQMRQFYTDRQFDRFPLHHATVRKVSATHAQIYHDWLSGIGDATLDSSFHMTAYSGAGTTYKVEVERLSTPPDVAPISAAFTARETQQGKVTDMSPRDTVRATIGGASFLVDYSRPLQRGRKLIGGVIPFGYIWRTGANAATQFSTSAPITFAGMQLPAGTYTLWTIPKPDGATLIVNKQTGQWGTSYDARQDLGRAALQVDSVAAPAEKFTIAIDSTDKSRGTMSFSWGTFRWTAPIEVKR